MRRFIARRLVASAATMLLVSIIVFTVARLQGDPRVTLLGEGGDTSQESYRRLGEEWGLDEPVIVQYGIYLKNVLSGRLGDSILQRRPVTTLIMARVPTTLKIAGGAFAIGISSGVLLGILAAIKRGSVIDLAARAIAVVGSTMPVFLIALVLIVIFAVNLGWVPPARNDSGLRSYILPWITMGWTVSAGQLRLVRASMLGVLGSEFVTLARAKGVSKQMVIFKHVLRNALIAPLTSAGLTLAWMLTGSIIVESVFSLPGLGQLAIQSALSGDYPLLQGIVLIVSAAYLAMALLVDVLYTLVDPRIRLA